MWRITEILGKGREFQSEYLIGSQRPGDGLESIADGV